MRKHDETRGLRPPPPDPGVPGPGLVYRFAAWLGLTVMRIQRWRFEVAGVENVPASGGCVIAANHNSFWDFFAVGRGPYLRSGRPPRILAKISLFRLPVFGRLMYRTGCIPVDRGNGGDALTCAVAALGRGELVLILPEGTISRSFDLLPFHSGAVRMAQAAGVPIVPAVSWGSHRFYSSGRRPRWSWRLPVAVRYGPPMTVEPEDDLATAAADLQRRVAALLDDAIDTYADGCPAGAWWVPRRLGGGAPDHAAVDVEHRERRATWRRRRRQAPPE